MDPKQKARDTVCAAVEQVRQLYSEPSQTREESLERAGQFASIAGTALTGLADTAWQTVQEQHNQTQKAKEDSPASDERPEALTLVKLMRDAALEAGRNHALLTATAAHRFDTPVKLATNRPPRNAGLYWQALYLLNKSIHSASTLFSGMAAQAAHTNYSIQEDTRRLQRREYRDTVTRAVLNQYREAWNTVMEEALYATAAESTKARTAARDATYQALRPNA